MFVTPELVQSMILAVSLPELGGPSPSRLSIAVVSAVRAGHTASLDSEAQVST